VDAPSLQSVDAKECCADGQLVAGAQLASADPVSVQIAPVRRCQIVKDPETVARDEPSMTSGHRVVGEYDVTPAAAANEKFLRSAIPIQGEQRLRGFVLKECPQPRDDGGHHPRCAFVQAAVTLGWMEIADQSFGINKSAVKNLAETKRERVLAD
jgi:hypothetical protein